MVTYDERVRERGRWEMSPFLPHISFVNKARTGFKGISMPQSNSYVCGEDWKAGPLWITLPQKKVVMEKWHTIQNWKQDN